MIPLLLAGLAGCAGRAPAELSAPLHISPDPTVPGLCVPMFEAAGRFAKRDAAAWSSARQAITNGDASGALLHLETVAPHPAVQAVRLTASLIEEPPEPVDVDALLADWPDDPCLHHLAAVSALQQGDREAAVARIRRASTLDPTDPEIDLLNRVLSESDPLLRSQSLLEGADAFPEHVPAQLLAGQAALQVADLTGALRALSRAADQGVPDASEAVFHLWRMTGELEPYLQRAVDDGLPVSGPGFGDGGRLERYEAWLGLDPAVEDDLQAVLHTSMGDLRCTLFHRVAPITVINFVGLARGEQPWTDPSTGELASRKLYDGTRFHRVIPEFMVQGGDPLGTGEGFPGYRFPNELQPGIRFDRPGMLAMANSGPDTNGSQFFVTEEPTPHLDGLHTIFGACDDASVEVVKAMARVPVDRDDRPDDDILLTSIDFEVVPCISCTP